MFNIYSPRKGPSSTIYKWPGGICHTKPIFCDCTEIISYTYMLQGIYFTVFWRQFSHLYFKLNFSLKTNRKKSLFCLAHQRQEDDTITIQPDGQDWSLINHYKYFQHQTDLVRLKVWLEREIFVNNPGDPDKLTLSGKAGVVQKRDRALAVVRQRYWKYRQIMNIIGTLSLLYRMHYYFYITLFSSI